MAIGDHNMQTRRRRDLHGAVGKPSVATGLIINFFLNVTRPLFKLVLNIYLYLIYTNNLKHTGFVFMCRGSIV